MRRRFIAPLRSALVKNCLTFLSNHLVTGVSEIPLNQLLHDLSFTWINQSVVDLLNNEKALLILNETSHHIILLQNFEKISY